MLGEKNSAQDDSRYKCVIRTTTPMIVDNQELRIESPLSFVRMFSINLIFNLNTNLQLPERISRLEELAHNLWWSWSPEARTIFRSISVRLWRSTDHNPVLMLHQASQYQLERIAADPDFLKKYDELMTLFDHHMKDWSPLTNHPKIAYFSAEYGLHSSLPIYSGGLGILSGDQAKTMSDMGFDFTAVGFMYPKGYFDQEISPDGDQIADYPEIDIPNVAIEQAKLPSGEPLIVSLPMERPDDLLHLQVWLVRCGRVKMYLMDSNIDANDPENRDITTRLYGGNNEYRLRQEIALGIGAVRVLNALGIAPQVWHANEGHVAFMFVERLREAIASGMTLEDATESVRRSSVFTTHTPVPAGTDAFSSDLIAQYFWHYWPELGMTKEQFFALGAHESKADHATLFNMTALSFKLAARCNAVSKKHREVTAMMWPEYVGKDEGGGMKDEGGKDSSSSSTDQPSSLILHPSSLTSVTNGIHIRTWIAPEMEELFVSKLGTDWIDHLDDEPYWEKIREISDEDLWRARHRMKASLFSLITDRVRRKWLTGKEAIPQAGENIIAEGALLDPSIFTIGFARRFATYKRGTLIFNDLDRIKRIVNDPMRPVQIIFSGKAHPADSDGQQLIKEIWHHALDPAFGGRIAFLENYGMHTAKYLVRGCDLWMNNPKAPLEASGTSGMKAAINGLPNFSILDGWWIEGFREKDEGERMKDEGNVNDNASLHPSSFMPHPFPNGWGLEGATEGPQADQDQYDANQMYDLLEREIIPLYYDKATNGISHNWLKVVKESIATILPRFSSERMMREYAEKMYGPASSIKK
jgi:glycogen phosphorylase